MSPPESSVQSNTASRIQYYRAWDIDALRMIRKWCQEHTDRILAAYAPPFQEYHRLLIVTRSQSYDFELSDALSELEAELWNAGFECEILQVPSADETVLLHFFDPHTST